MNPSTLAQSALSRRSYLDAMSERFNQNDAGEIWNLFGVFALLVALIGTIWLIHRLQQQRRRPASARPMGLYRRVLRQLNLSVADRWRLRQLARVSDVEQPAALLISVSLFDAAVERYCTSTGLVSSRVSAAPAFADIRQRLFDTE